MRKKWIVLATGVAIVIAAMFIYVRAAFTPERLRALVEPRLEAALARPVDLGEIRLTVFPLAVRVDRLQVFDPAHPDVALLQVESLELHPRLAALLGRELRIRSIRVVRPEIRLEQNAEGKWNWSAPPRVGTGQPGQPAQPTSAVALTVDRFELQSGLLRVHSEPLKLDLRVPLDAEVGLRADRALRDVTLTGWLEADSIRAGDRGALRGLPPLRLRLEPRMRIDVPDSSATIDALRLFVNEAAIEMTGTARQEAGRPRVHIETRSESIDLARLLAALPPGTARAQGLTAAGTLQIDLRIDARPPAPPVARGRIDLRDGILQMAGLPERFENLTVALELAGDSIRVQDIAARIGGAPVRLSGVVTEALQPQRTHYDLQLQAALDLAQLAKAAPLPSGTSLAGKADVDVRIRGRTANPDSVWLEGPITLRGLDARSPLLLQPVRGDATLVGAGSQVRIESARFSAGNSDLALTGTIVPALPPRRPRAVLEGRSTLLDLAALLPAQAATGHPPSASAKADTAAAAPLLPLLPPVDLRGTLRASTVVLPTATLRDARLDFEGGPAGLDVQIATAALQAQRAELRDVRGTLHVQDQAGSGQLRAARATLQRLEVTSVVSDLAITGRQVRLDSLRGQAYAGTLRGRAHVDYADPRSPRYDLDLRGQKLDTNVFLSSMVPMLRNVVTGTVDLQSALGYSGSDPKAALTSLTGSGDANALGGRIQDLPLLSALSGSLGLPSWKSFPYRDLVMHFGIDAGRLSVRDLVLHGSDADFGVSGSVGLDGSLDLGLHVQLSEAVSKRYLSGKSTAALGTLFADPNGRLAFDFKVGGSYRSPKLQPDLQKTASTTGLRTLTRDALQRLLEGLALPQIGGAGSPVPGVSTPPGRAAGDSSQPPARTVEDAGKRALEDAQRRAADEAKRKLGDKLGGLFKKSAPAETTGTRADSLPR